MFPPRKNVQISLLDHCRLSEISYWRLKFCINIAKLLSLYSTPVKLQNFFLLHSLSYRSFIKFNICIEGFLHFLLSNFVHAICNAKNLKAREKKFASSPMIFAWSSDSYIFTRLKNYVATQSHFFGLVLFAVLVGSKHRCLIQVLHLSKAHRTKFQSFKILKMLSFLRYYSCTELSKH